MRRTFCLSSQDQVFFTVIQDQVTRRDVILKNLAENVLVRVLVVYFSLQDRLISKYVLNIEGWFCIERDGLTVTWIRFPDHKCLSRNRFPKDLVNNMPLYTTAVNCVLAFSQQANFYLQQKVGGAVLRWY